MPCRLLPAPLACALKMPFPFNQQIKRGDGGRGLRRAAEEEGSRPIASIRRPGHTKAIDECTTLRMDKDIKRLGLQIDVRSSFVGYPDDVGRARAYWHRRTAPCGRRGPRHVRRRLAARRP